MSTVDMDTCCLSRDKYGCDMLLVRKEHLENFSLLIAWIRKKGYGQEVGLLKLRLHPDDRQDKDNIRILEVLKRKFNEKASKKPVKNFKVVKYFPDCQLFFRAAANDHIYEYVRMKCTPSERKDFVEMAVQLNSYNDQVKNCCTESLESDGLDGIRKHCFSVLHESAPQTELLQEKERQWLAVNNGASTSSTVDVHKMQGLIYGADIQIDPDIVINICGKFTMSSFNSILDHMEEEFDGISFPYLYCGTPHAQFPWHMEDGALFSINYLFGGAPKLWYGFPPKYFGLVDKITSGFKMDRGHTGCRALLADHKALVADPEYFRKHHGVPYVTIVQEPGDFIITFPFALHSGFNLGNNLAVAGNFADEDWIEEGMYAPVCDCNKSQVRLNLTNILKQCRPDLLEKYLRSTSLMFPLGHPLDVIRCPLDPPVTMVEKGTQTVKPYSHDRTSVTSQDNHTIPVPGKHEKDTPVAVVAKCAQNTKSLRKKNATSPKLNAISLPDEHKKKSHGGIKERTLYCPKCNQSFKENKMGRLRRHISKSHSDKEHLLRLVNVKYKPWKPKGTAGHACKLCGVFRRGSITHIRGHHLKKHSNAPFEGAVKKLLHS